MVYAIHSTRGMVSGSTTWDIGLSGVSIHASVGQWVYSMGRICVSGSVGLHRAK